MKKICSLIIVSCLAMAAFAQETREIVTIPLSELLQTSCTDVNVCVQYEEDSDKAQCVQEALENSCGTKLDLDAIAATLFDKRKSVTTGVRNEGWERILKSIFATNKLEIIKKQNGISVSVVNKETKNILVNTMLSPVNSKTYASSSSKKFSVREIGAFIDKRKPTYNNALVLVKMMLKSCSFSVSIK